MSKENSTTGDMVKRLFLMAVVGSFVVTVLLNLDRWWAWVLTAAAAAAFVVYVRRIAAKWLEVLEDTAIERTHPAPIDDEVPTLIGHGFGHPLQWKTLQSDRVSIVSVDGTVGAMISDGWSGPLLMTRWEAALLRTSSGGVGVPICSGDYLQIPGDSDFEILLATHQEAIGVLNRRYGPPIQSEPPSVVRINEQARHILAVFKARRYRQTAKVIATSFMGGYAGHLARRLAPRTPVWLSWLMLAVLGGMLVFSWLIAIPDHLPLGVIATLVYGRLGIGSLLELLQQRKFR